ncbi:MAG TPA: carboxypeptidase regulatory-like domain-containing protein [Pirellulales bacterium]|nr:carboxypeptidase regulatory-like domain-containing protein [Pirellulales bacterium]
MYTTLVLLAISVVGAADDAPSVVGTVVDAKNQPVAGTEIYLFEGPFISSLALFEAGSKTRQPPPLLARAQSNEAGEFEVAMPLDAQMAYGGLRTWFALAVHKPGLAVKTRLIGRDWPSRAAPIRVALDRPRNNRVRVASFEGQPAGNARVWVDQLDGIMLPVELAERLAAQSDASGEAELPDVAGEQLRIVRVGSPQFGDQWAGLNRPINGEARTVSLSPVGRVNGRLLDDGGKPIASTRVRLASWIDPHDEWSGGGLAEATTDDEGRFKTAAIAAGVLQITAILPEDSPLVSTYRGTQSLEAGATNDVVARFQHGVRIRGTIVDEADGSPVVGAVRPFGFVGSRRTLLGAAFECDEAGEYSGYVLPGLTYLSLARLPPDYYDRDRFAREEPVPDDATEVTFAPVRVARGETLVGRVVDTAGRPIADAHVVGVFRPDRFEYVVTARSDRDGNFLLTRVAPNADVHLSATSAAGCTIDALVVHMPHRDWLTLTVDAGAAWSLSGRVVNASGHPIVGAALRIDLKRTTPTSQDSGYVTFDGHEQIYTDASGRFATPKHLRPGRRYQIEIDARGMMPESTEPIEQATGPTTNVADIVLTPTPRLRSVVGRVVDESSTPVAGVAVWQSGDGPRGTHSTSDAEGRFRIDGVYEGTAWLFTSHDGFPLQAERIEGDGAESRVVLRRGAAPKAAPVRHAQPATLLEEEAVMRTLLEEYRAWLERESRIPRRGPQWVKAIDYMLDGKFSTTPDGRLDLDFGTAPAFMYWTPEQAQELAEATTDTYWRAMLYLGICDARGDAPDRQRDSLAHALLAARTIDDVNRRVFVLTEISTRFFDLGDRDLGAALVREARERLAVAVDDGLDPEVRQGRVAAALARVDAPAGLALAEKPKTRVRDIYLAEVACGLAAENPELAEQAIDQVRQYRFEYCAGAVRRMAAVDPERAERIARKFSPPSRQAYGLGLVAHAQAATNQELAARLLEDAYGLLEQSLAEGTADEGDSACGTAAALLVMVERVDPKKLDQYLARALAMRPPRPARPPRGDVAAPTKARSPRWRSLSLPTIARRRGRCWNPSRPAFVPDGRCGRP